MASVIFEEQLEIPLGIRSLEDFRRWTRSVDFPERGRIDFVAGHIEVDMQAEELHSHGGVKVAIVAALFAINDEVDLGELFSDSTRIASVPADLSCEPDVVFLTHESIESGRVRYVPKTGQTDRYIEIEGGPDLVVEIVSDSSVSKDNVRLPSAYFVAGVREYWLVDARGDELQFQIHCRGNSVFEPVAARDDGYQRSEVFSRWFQLQRSRNRHGHWKYELDDRM